MRRSGPERDEGLGFVQARLEFADVTGIVCTLDLEDTDLRAQLLQLSVIYRWWLLGILVGTAF